MEVYYSDPYLPRFTQDFLKKIHVEKDTLLYHLRKLTKKKLLKEIKSYPKSWCGVDEDTRKEVEDLIVKVQRLVK